MPSKKSVAGTGADPVIRFAKLELDGETYRLAYSFNAIATAEHVAECNLLSGLESLNDMSALQLRGLLYAAMSVADPKVTIHQAGALIRLDTLVPITNAIAEAYRLSMPEKKQDPPQAPPADPS
jgi:hypothetical protein